MYSKKDNSNSQYEGGSQESDSVSGDSANLYFFFVSSQSKHMHGNKMAAAMVKVNIDDLIGQDSPT